MKEILGGMTRTKFRYSSFKLFLYCNCHYANKPIFKNAHGRRCGFAKLLSGIKNNVTVD